MMPPAQVVRHPWIFSVIMPSCVVGTRPLLDSSFANALFSRPAACSYARRASFIWSSHSTCVCHGVRGLSLVVVLGLLGPRISSYTAGEVTTTVGVPLACGGVQDVASTSATIEQVKRDKHTQTCASQRFDFLPFGFSVFCSFGPTAQELLDRIAEWEADASVYSRLSFIVMRGVADQFVS